MEGRRPDPAANFFGRLRRAVAAVLPWASRLLHFVWNLAPVLSQREPLRVLCSGHPCLVWRAAGVRRDRGHVMISDIKIGLANNQFIADCDLVCVVFAGVYLMFRSSTFIFKIQNTYARASRRCAEY